MNFNWLFLLQIFVLVNGRCNFNKQQIEQETRLITIKQNNHYKLFFGDNVSADKTLYFICNDTDVVSVTCMRNGEFSRILPIGNCDKPIKAKISTINDATCSAATMYRVGYETEADFLELYRTCYNATTMRALYAVNDYTPYSLATSRPQSGFTVDGIINIRDAASFQASKIYDRFRSLLGEEQQFAKSNKDILIHRGHLIPVGDYMHVNNMRATLKYINVMPQFHSINQGNWKTIETFIRRLAVSSGKMRTLVGTLGVLKLLNENNQLVELYLLNGNRNAIPEWNFKIITDGLNSIVFLTYNNIYEDSAPTPPCIVTNCPPSINLRNSKESGITYCCNAIDFIRRNNFQSYF